MRDVWALINSHHPRLLLISYGSPYLVYDMQTAVLKIITGEAPALGTPPVDLDAPYQIKRMAFKFIGENLDD